MAVNESRSLNHDLWEGITDGAVKKDAPSRGGVVEPDAHQSHLLQAQYGMMSAYGAASDAARRITAL